MLNLIVYNESIMRKNSYTVGSLFAGVGGICQGFKNAGYSVSWANELDKNACETYKLNHNKTNLIVGDINDINISNLEKIDILTAGFPCQPFSHAGNRKGFDDDRGQVFYRVIDFLNHLKPKAFLLENVKNLVTHSDGQAINFIDNHKVLSSFDFGVAQARKRLFAGEVISTGKFPDLENKTGKTVREIFKDFPKSLGSNQVASESNCY
jgi:DNA-cytosine methyltransferase